MTDAEKRIVELASTFANKNRKDLEAVTVCGCYFCAEVFDPVQIKEWVDDDQTALCPHCSIDSVIAGVTDKELLVKCGIFWFYDINGNVFSEGI